MFYFFALATVLLYSFLFFFVRCLDIFFFIFWSGHWKEVDNKVSVSFSVLAFVSVSNYICVWVWVPTPLAGTNNALAPWQWTTGASVWVMRSACARLSAKSCSLGPTTTPSRSIMSAGNSSSVASRTRVWQAASNFISLNRSRSHLESDKLPEWCIQSKYKLK